MENFPKPNIGQKIQENIKPETKQYRDELAEDLKTLRKIDPDVAQEFLEEKQESEGYRDAQEDIQDIRNAEINYSNIEKRESRELSQAEKEYYSNVDILEKKFNQYLEENRKPFEGFESYSDSEVLALINTTGVKYLEENGHPSVHGEIRPRDFAIYNAPGFTTAKPGPFPTKIFLGSNNIKFSAETINEKISVFGKMKKISDDYSEKGYAISMGNSINNRFHELFYEDQTQKGYGRFVKSTEEKISVLLNIIKSDMYDVYSNGYRGYLEGGNWHLRNSVSEADLKQIKKAGNLDALIEYSGFNAKLKKDDYLELLEDTPDENKEEILNKIDRLFS